MVDKQKIIQYWHVEKKSEVEIATELGLSRNTVRRYLKSFRKALEESHRSELPEPILSDFLLTIPKYNARNRGKRKLTTEIMQMIDGYLKENDEKRRTGRSKQILKGIDIWELLQASGQDIGYTVVCDYIRLQKSGHEEAFIRQEYNPGENCEFDWCDALPSAGLTANCTWPPSRCVRAITGLGYCFSVRTPWRLWRLISPSLLT